jgi:hypothetical protein
MSGDTQSTDGSGLNPVWIAVGRSLVAMYEGYIHSPLPERLAELLRQLDLRGQDPLPPDAGP